MNDNTSAKMIEKTAAEIGSIVLGRGQFGYAYDTDVLKIGDGVSTWDARPAFGSGGGGGLSGVFVGLNYLYSSATSASGIANGTFRLNSTNLGSATKLYISDTDGLNYAQSAYWDLFTSGTITLHRSSPEGYVTFKVTRMVAQTGYHEFDVTFVGGATGFLNTDEIRMAVTMDAPGVREFIADIDFENDDISAVHKNSLIGSPVYAAVGAAEFTLTLANAFTVGKTHGYASGLDENSKALPISFVNNATADEVRFIGPDPTTYAAAGINANGGGFISVTIKVYN